MSLPAVTWKEKWLTGRRDADSKLRLPPAWLLALDSHLAWGFGVPSFFGGTVGGWFGGGIGAFVILVVAFLNEYFADPYFEGQKFFWDGVEDLAEYVGGIALAFVLYYLVTL